MTKNVTKWSRSYWIVFDHDHEFFGPIGIYILWNSFNSQKIRHLDRFKIYVKNIRQDFNHTVPRLDSREGLETRVVPPCDTKIMRVLYGMNYETNFWKIGKFQKDVVLTPLYKPIQCLQLRL